MDKSKWLNPRLKSREHLVQLVLVVLSIILSGVYLSMVDRPSRSDIMVIVYGIKSIVVIGYQLLSDHTHRFSKWKSLKAYAILNCVEVVLWLTAIVLKCMSISTRCSGNSCAVNWITLFIVFLIFFVSLHVAVVSVVEHRSVKKYGV